MQSHLLSPIVIKKLIKRYKEAEDIETYRTIFLQIVMMGSYLAKKVLIGGAHRYRLCVLQDRDIGPRLLTLLPGLLKILKIIAP